LNAQGVATARGGRWAQTRTETGQIEIEPAELFRVFPPLAQRQGAQEATHPHARATGDNALQDSALSREVQLLREMLEAMREDRDAWREQARKEGDERRELAQRLALAAPITTPPPQPVAAPEAANQRPPFLKRLRQRLVG
jgi:Lon protease-like protein